MPCPTIPLVPMAPPAFCTGGSVMLSGPVGLTYHWSTGATTQSINATQSGSYTLTVTNSNNCSAISQPTTVTVNGSPLDVVYAGGPLSFCSGDSVVLTANPGVNGLTYVWSNGATTQSITIKQSGSYNVTVTNSNNCSIASSANVITVNPLPSDSVTITGSTSICSGGHVILTAVAGLTYRWSNNATTQSITVVQAGNYSVTVVNSYNCSASSTPVQVTVGSTPDDTVSVNGPTTFCSGDSVTLTAAPGLTYHWSNSATSQAIAVSQSGSYTVTVTNGNNCSAASTAIPVTVNPSPSATVTPGGPTTFCSGGNVTLTAPAGLTYLWSNASATQSITVLTSGTYLVTVTNNNQCTAVSSPTIVVVNTTTLISTQPVSQVSCVNGSVTFSVTASGDNITYQWQKNGSNLSGQTGSTYSITQAALSDTGNYRVIVSGVCGKDTSAVASLSVAASLTVSQQPVPQVACLGSSVNFTVVANGGNTTFQWRKNGQNITNANSSTYHIGTVSAADTGYYSCYVTSSCGNATSDSAKLSISLPSAYSFSESICGGNHYNFNGRLITTAGTYVDTLTNYNNCDSIVTLTLTVSPPPVYSYSDSICVGTSYSFYDQNLTSAGVYSDTLVTGAGCDSIITLHLSLKQVASSNTSATICQGAVYNFNGQAYTSTGTYQATLTGANGCDSIALLHLTVNPTSSSNINVSICPNQSYNFNGRVLTSGGTYLDTLTNTMGCDSFITLHLTNITTITYSYNAMICAGNNYNFHGHLLNATGSYSDTLPSVGGCDSIITVNLTVNPVFASSYSASVCSGATYTFGGRYFVRFGQL